MRTLAITKQELEFKFNVILSRTHALTNVSFLVSLLNDDPLVAWTNLRPCHFTLAVARLPSNDLVGSVDVSSLLSNADEASLVQQQATLSFTFDERSSRADTACFVLDERTGLLFGKRAPLSAMQGKSSMLKLSVRVAGTIGASGRRCLFLVDVFVALESEAMDGIKSVSITAAEWRVHERVFNVESSGTDMSQHFEIGVEPRASRLFQVVYQSLEQVCCSSFFSRKCFRDF